MLAESTSWPSARNCSSIQPSTFAVLPWRLGLPRMVMIRMAWFRAGYCTVPNPFDAKQVALISLRPEDVDAIVFWTRNPRLLMPHLDELDSLGYKYDSQFRSWGIPERSTPGLLPPRPPSRRSVTLREG
jgi:hypothetical protein